MASGDAYAPGSAPASRLANALEQLKWLIGALAIPLVLAWAANQFNERETKRAADDRNASELRAAKDREVSEARSLQDARLKAYGELLNKREADEMAVRKEIFSALLGRYFDPVKGDVAHRMTVLELLAGNFDESLNLSPLFWQLDRELRSERRSLQDRLRGRLSRLATEVKQRQADVLAAGGASASWTVDLTPDGLAEVQPPLPLTFTEPTETGSVAAKGCMFQVSLLGHEPEMRRVYARVDLSALTDPPPKDSPCISNAGSQEGRSWGFWVDEFDFPMINYTRLSTGERFALVMEGYKPEEARATLKLVYFPSSRGGARDRPFLDTVVARMNGPVDVRSAAPAASAPRR
jgi:hypothetical protein